MRLDTINEYFLCTYILQLKKKVQQAKAAQGMEVTRLGDLAMSDVEMGLDEPPDVEFSPSMPVIHAPRKRRPARDAQTAQTAEVAVDRDAGSNLVGAQRRLFENRLDRLLQMDPNPSQAEKTNFGLWLAAVSANMPDHHFVDFQQRAQDLCNHYVTSRWTAHARNDPNPLPGQFQQPAPPLPRQMSDPTGQPAGVNTPQQGRPQYSSQYSGDQTYHTLQPAGMNTSLPSFSSVDSTGMGSFLGMLSPSTLVTGGIGGGGLSEFSQSQSQSQSNPQSQSQSNPQSQSHVYPHSSQQSNPQSQTPSSQ